MTGFASCAPMTSAFLPPTAGFAQGTPGDEPRKATATIAATTNRSEGGSHTLSLIDGIGSDAIDVEVVPGTSINGRVQNPFEEDYRKDAGSRAAGRAACRGAKARFG